MRGMSASTGKAIEGVEHLQQSIADVLTTPMGSRVMRRDYGALLPELIDQPFNDATKVRLFAATAMALMKWEPRLQLKSIALQAGNAPGKFTLELNGIRTDQPPPNTRRRLMVPLNFYAV